MTKNNFFKKLISKQSLLLVLMSLAMYFYNCYYATYGLYLFDFAITYDMGWYIFNGWIPFVDFRMPLMPLSGILTALSFYIFGVKYYSAAKLVGIVCVLSFIYMGRKLQNYIEPVFAYCAAFFIVLATLPVHGTFFYNQLSMLLFSIYLVLFLDYILKYENFLGKKETTSSLIIFFFIALISLNKFHIGILSGLLFVAFEAYLLFQKKYNPKDVALSLFIRISPLIILTFSLLIWIKFQVFDLVDNLFYSANGEAFFDENALMARMGIGGSNNIYSSSGINMYLILLVSAGLIFYHFKFRRKKILADRLLCFIIFSSIVQILSFIPSAEAPASDIAFILIYLVMFYIYLRITCFENESNCKESRYVCLILLSAIFITCATFTIDYTRRHLRKAYDDNIGAFPYANFHLGDTYNLGGIKFFDEINVSWIQAKNFYYLNNIAKENSAKNIFFGPELEMFYIVTKKFPPKNWPLWMHVNVSYNADKQSAMRKIFIEQNYDVVVISKHRYEFTDFLNDYISKEYVELKQTDPDMWIRVFVRK